MSRALLLPLLLLAAPDRDAAWREDLAFLVAEIPARHANAFSVLPREEFERRAKALLEAIPGFDDERMEAELSGLVAGLGDSHTLVAARTLYEGGSLPFALWWWKDGLRVMEAPKEHASAAGMRLVGIGDHGLDEVAARLRRFEAIDNDSLLKQRLPHRILFPRLLRALGFVAAPSAVPLRLEGDDGKKTTIVAAPAPRAAGAVRVVPKSVPVTAPRRGRMHARSFLEDEGLLYIQYNQCATNPEQDLDRFTGECAELCATGRVKSIVFDLQYNGGGDSRLGDAMFGKLAAHAPMKEKRNVFCIVGRGTFSSAILNAKSLQSQYGALLVGEPTGGSPNHFGEVRSFTLPNSKLQVWYSTKRFERGPPGATTVEPDLRAEAALADWVEGRDPVLDAIRAAVR